MSRCKILFVETELSSLAMPFSKVLVHFWSCVDCSHLLRCSLLSNKKLFGCINEDLTGKHGSCSPDSLTETYHRLP